MLPERVRHLLEPDSHTVQLARLFASAGFELYLVGGSVRDLFLQRPHEDLDYATNARPEQIKGVVEGWAQGLYTAGELFGTVGVVREGVTAEITTFRREVYRETSRKPEVRFSDDITTDLSRRDFTINALALRLEVGGEGSVVPTMIDPWEGLHDLAARVLRTPLAPEVSFGDDPLRMLRLYRFVATLGFDAHPATEQAAVDLHERLAIVSAERIRDELERLLVGENVGPALWGLVNSGLAAIFLPDLPALALEQDPHHSHKDVLAHTIAVVEKCPPDLLVRLAALFHDVGKPATRAFGPGGVSFHHHEVVGARMTRERLRALRFPRQMVEDVARLVYLHMRPHTYKMGWTDRAVRRYVRDAGPLLEPLNALVRCDVTTRNLRRERAVQNRITELEERIVELREREEIDRLRPPVDGHQVMEYLGLPPGPAVGEVMDMLMEHRIEEGPYSVDEAHRLMDGWAAARKG